MFILHEKKKSEPATFKHTFRGKEISLTVRPYDADEIKKLTKKRTSYEYQENPRTRQLCRVEIVDYTALGEDAIDYLLVEITGFGKSETESLEMTRENKLRIVALEPGPGERTLYEVVQARAKELAGAVEVKEEEARKNSSGPSATE